MDRLFTALKWAKSTPLTATVVKIMVRDSTRDRKRCRVLLTFSASIGEMVRAVGLESTTNGLKVLWAHDPDTIVAWGAAEIHEREVESFSMGKLLQYRGLFGPRSSGICTTGRCRLRRCQGRGNDGK